MWLLALGGVSSAQTCRLQDAMLLPDHEATDVPRNARLRMIRPESCPPLARPVAELDGEEIFVTQVESSWLEVDPLDMEPGLHTVAWVADDPVLRREITFEVADRMAAPPAVPRAEDLLITVARLDGGRYRGQLDARVTTEEPAPLGVVHVQAIFDGRPAVRQTWLASSGRTYRGISLAERRLEEACVRMTHVAPDGEEVLVEDCGEPSRIGCSTVAMGPGWMGVGLGTLAWLLAGRRRRPWRLPGVVDGRTDGRPGWRAADTLSVWLRSDPASQRCSRAPRSRWCRVPAMKPQRTGP